MPNSVRQQLADYLGVPVRDEWWNLHSPNRKTFRLLLTAFLWTDIAESSPGSLPVGWQHEQHLHGRFVFQVQEVVNIAAPAKDRYQAKPANRCLKLRLCDGPNTVHGVEVVPCGVLSVDMYAGTKITVNDAPVQRGTLMLMADAVTMLGGGVVHLERARKRLLAHWNRPHDCSLLTVQAVRSIEEVMAESRSVAWHKTGQPAALAPCAGGCAGQQPQLQGQAQLPPPGAAAGARADLHVGYTAAAPVLGPPGNQQNAQWHAQLAPPALPHQAQLRGEAACAAPLDSSATACTAQWPGNGVTGCQPSGLGPHAQPPYEPLPAREAAAGAASKDACDQGQPAPGTPRSPSSQPCVITLLETPQPVAAGLAGDGWDAAGGGRGSSSETGLDEGFLSDRSENSIGKGGTDGRRRAGGRVCNGVQGTQVAAHAGEAAQRVTVAGLRALESEQRSACERLLVDARFEYDEPDLVVCKTDVTGTQTTYMTVWKVNGELADDTGRCSARLNPAWMLEQGLGPGPQYVVQQMLEWQASGQDDADCPRLQQLDGVLGRLVRFTKFRVVQQMDAPKWVVTPIS